MVFYQMTFRYKGFFILNEQDRKDFRDKLENFVSKSNEKSGPSLQFFLSTYDVWPWVKFNEIIVGDAQQGVVFSLLFAFFVLLVTTQNIIVSILSTYSISSIILQMMAMIHFNDWTFGII